MDLDKAEQGKEASSIWMKVKLNNFDRSFQKAVIEPVSRRLWLMAGDYNGKFGSATLQKISLNVVPLQILSKECAAKNISTCNPRLGLDRFPKKLKEEIDAFRCE